MSVQQKVSACLIGMIDEGFIPGASVLVLKGGREVLYVNEGMADMENGVPVRRDSVFRLFSMTKPVIAAAAALLAERGKIDFSDYVEKYLPGFENQSVLENGSLVRPRRRVDLMDLLGMCGGLTYDGADEPGRQIVALMKEVQEKRETPAELTTAQIANRIGRIPLAYQPGTRARYSVSADVLGAVIEAAAGEPLSAFLKREFFEPLGMKDTGFCFREEHRGRIPVVYSKTGGKLVPLIPEKFGVTDFFREPAFASGGGGLVSTIDDYARFCSMLLGMGETDGHRILSPESVRFLMEPQHGEEKEFEILHELSGTAYGKFMRHMVSPGKFPGFARMDEYGWDGWLGTYMANFPHEDMTVLVMTQVADGRIPALHRRIRNVILACESLGEI